MQIDRGILALSRDPAVRDFAKRHVAAESRHLSLMEATVPPACRSRLLSLWRAAGWVTGALPTAFNAMLFGRAALHGPDVLVQIPTPFLWVITDPREA